MRNWRKVGISEEWKRRRVQQRQKWVGLKRHWAWGIAARLSSSAEGFRSTTSRKDLKAGWRLLSADLLIPTDTWDFAITLWGWGGVARCVGVSMCVFCLMCSRIVSYFCRRYFILTPSLAHLTRRHELTEAIKRLDWTIMWLCVNVATLSCCCCKGGVGMLDQLDYPVLRSCINRLLPLENQCKTHSESQCAAKIYTLGGGKAAWDLRWMLQRGPCHVISEVVHY